MRARNRFILVIVIFVMSVSTFFAQGTAFSIYGKLINEDGSPPDSGCVEFWVTSSGRVDTLTEDSSNCEYEITDGEGYWYAHVDPNWHGDTVKVRFVDTCKSEIGTVIDIVDTTDGTTQYFGVTSLHYSETVDVYQNRLRSLENKISVYPNPFTDVLNVKGTKKFHGGKLSIFDETGQCVREIPFDGQDKRIRWKPEKSLPNGIYFLQINLGERTFKREVIFTK